ncbi:hypothetical protein HC341_16075 [Aquisalimonas sp. 2447]|uniref:Ig-like domain-containing protein n=1 Tax=Aquisalimonas sp. 2447 TaxID=2740807 RepID=UPI0014327F25|nr:Ig-like domain-containing protein [Aquisalimonas sp. 2447]QIT56578.1 hypothetical protein HC341_16075 [Aquisalimonas sp. 2447]
MQRSGFTWTKLGGVALTIFALLLMAGCFSSGSGGGGSSGGDEPTAPDWVDVPTAPDGSDDALDEVAIEELQVLASRDSVVEGRTVRLTALALYEDGSEDNVTEQAEWEVQTDGDAVAVRLDGLDDGQQLVRGMQAGQSAGVSASFGGVSGGTTISVVAPSIETLEIRPTEPRPVRVAVGSSVQLTAVGSFENETTDDLTGDVAWQSANTDIANVADGLVNAEQAGTAVITATYDGENGQGDADATVDIEVFDPGAVEAIRLTTGECGGSDDLSVINVDRSQVLGIVACAEYEGDQSAENISDVATWGVAENDESVARIESVGGDPASARIAGVTAGDAALTVAFGGVEKQATISVDPAENQPGALSLRARPDVILAGADDPTEITAAVRANDPETGVISERQDLTLTVSPTGVLGQVPGTLEAHPDGGIATGSFSASATADNPTLVRLGARLPGTILERRIPLRVVTDFGQIFQRYGAIHPDRRELIAILIVNTSNRPFDVENLEVQPANQLIDPSELIFQTVPAGSSIFQIVELPSDDYLDQENVELRFNLIEPRTQEQFSVSVRFF